MASSPKVGMSSSVSGISGSSWAPGGGRPTSGEPIDTRFDAGAIGVRGGWRPSNDDTPRQGFYFFSRDSQDTPGDESGLFTPLMSRRAGAFAAIEPYSETRATVAPFMTELTHAVSVYEFNMKAIAGTLSPQGAVINRYG